MLRLLLCVLTSLTDKVYLTQSATRALPRLFVLISGAMLRLLPSVLTSMTDKVYLIQNATRALPRLLLRTNNRAQQLCAATVHKACAAQLCATKVDGTTQVPTEISRMANNELC